MIAMLRPQHAPWIALITAIVLWPVPRQLLELWMNADRPYSHGLLLAPLAVALLFRAARSSPGDAAAPSWCAVILFGVLVFVWLLGVSADMLVVQQALFPVLIVLAIASVAGWVSARRCAFPVSLLFFAIPLWDYGVPLLQKATVAVVGASLDRFSIPVYVEGNLVSIPEGTFEVAGGCAGLHYLLVALVVGCLHAYANVNGAWARGLVVGVVVLLAMVANWIRVGSLVVVGHLSDMQHFLVAEDHYYFGWIIFAAMLPLYFLGIRRIGISQSEPASSPVPGPNRGDRRRGDAGVGAILLFCLLAAVPLYVTSKRVAVDASGYAGMVEIELPALTGEWSGPHAVTDGSWSPRFEGADGQVIGRYFRGELAPQALVAVYLHEGQGRELIGDANRFASGMELTRAYSRVPVAEVPGGEVGERVFVDAGGREREQLVWYWYVVGDGAVVSAYEAKLRQAIWGLTRGATAGAVVAMSVDCVGECGAEARDALAQFAAVAAQPLHRVANEAYIGRVGG